ncbi:MULTISPECIES: hypothetical protein [Rhodococcus]|uniref:Uncharacterized protein n=1 Tax=Rhodococcus baikonurensis TaxID=172041 RepID=A0ABV5XMN4_9NOCA|nr:MULTISPECIES: hypothetical protein [Rhodococcus]
MMDQPPSMPNVSEVRYAKEQAKIRKRADDERKRNLAAELRRKALETKQSK